jgi:hypothetical protein
LTAIDVGLDSGDGFVDYFLGFVEIDFGMIVSIKTDKVDGKTEGVWVIVVFGADMIGKSIDCIDG